MKKYTLVGGVMNPTEKARDLKKQQASISQEERDAAHKELQDQPHRRIRQLQKS